MCLRNAGQKWESHPMLSLNSTARNFNLTKCLANWKREAAKIKRVLLQSSYCIVSMVQMLLCGACLWTCERNRVFKCKWLHNATVLAIPWLEMNVRWKCLCLTVGFFLQVLFHRVMRTLSSVFTLGVPQTPIIHMQYHNFKMFKVLWTSVDSFF